MYGQVYLMNKKLADTATVKQTLLFDFIHTTARQVVVA